MSFRFQHAVAAMVVVPMLGLAGCAQTPAAVTEASAAGPFIKLSPPRPRPRRPDPCKLVKPDLPTERKEALFKQFSAELASDPAVPATPPPTAASIDACKPAAR